MIETIHTNRRLRGYTVIGGRRKREIAEMTPDQYKAFRKEVRNEIRRRGNGPGIKKHEDELLRRVAVARKGIVVPQGVNDFEQKSSPILDALYPARQKPKKWIAPRKRKGEVKQIDLRKFSLIDEPDLTLSYLCQMAEAESRSPNMKVNFRDNMCFDMAPYLILALMKDAFPPSLLQGGRIREEVEKVLKAVGIWDYMQLARAPSEKPVTGEEAKPQAQAKVEFSPDSDIMPFNLRKGGGLEAKNLALSAQRDGKVANEFVDTLRAWVLRHNPDQEINDDMGGRIKKVMTELFDNALRHGLPETETGEWHTVGVLQKKKDRQGRNIVVCNVAILNLGQTIAETLEMAPEKVKRDIQTYVSMHKGTHEPDVLATLCALQDKISRIDPDDEKNAKLNGVGLMTTIANVFNPLFQSDVPEYQPSFTLVSGRAWISACHPYNSPSGDYGKRRLAFNSENDIRLPPDERHVKCLSRRFPGTIISIRFVIGAEQLSTNTKESQE